MRVPLVRTLVNEAINVNPSCKSNQCLIWRTKKILRKSVRPLGYCYCSSGFFRMWCDQRGIVALTLIWQGYSECTVSVQWVFLLSLHWHCACVLCVKHIPPEIARWHWLHYWPVPWRLPFGQPARICEEQCFLSRLHGTTIGMCVKLCPTCPTAFLICVHVCDPLWL